MRSSSDCFDYLVWLVWRKKLWGGERGKGVSDLRCVVVGVFVFLVVGVGGVISIVSVGGVLLVLSWGEVIWELGVK